MKRFLLLILTIFFFIPSTIKAVEINEITVVGKENITIGESFTESILISFNSLERNYQQELGLFYLKYEVNFNNSLLIPTAIESSNWDTVMYQENGKYYVFSIVNPNNHPENICPHSFLYCADYRATIEFFLNETTENNTSINIKDIEIALIDMSTYQEKYTLEDIITKNSDKTSNYNLMINQPTISTEITSPQDIVIDLSPDEITEKIINALNQEPIITNMSSNLLKNLTIAGYNIEFNKFKNNYIITVPEEVTTLEFQITPEDQNATYNVIGNEKLIDGSKISIEVTSFDNQVNTYTINIKKQLLEEHGFQPSTQKLTLTEFFHKYQPYIKYVTIFVGIILVILIIIKIISKVKDKKIEDMTNKF